MIYNICLGLAINSVAYSIIGGNSFYYLIIIIELMPKEG